MITIIPELNGQEERVLYIIGNGFDLYHNIPSRYRDFYYWLKENGPQYEEFTNDMQTIFHRLNNEESTLWSNFEEALGQYDVDKIYKYYYRSPDNLSSENKYEIAGEQVVSKVRNVSEKIRPLMTLWAKQIDLSHVRPKLRLAKQSYFFTFNYTNVLEDVYNISPEHICHIHGCIDDIGEMITGHNTILSTNDINAESDEEELAKQKIVREMNKLGKDQDTQIVKHKLFFLSLPVISHVVVIGHSLANIDIRYFGEILSTIPHDTKWYFSTHLKSDDERIERFVKSTKPNPIKSFQTFHL